MISGASLLGSPHYPVALGTFLSTFFLHAPQLSSLAIEDLLSRVATRPP